MVTDEEQARADQLKKMAGAGAYLPPQDRYGSAITTLTDPQEDLIKFELFLRAQRYNMEGQLVKSGDALLNDKGINTIMASIESLVHHMNTLSNFNTVAVEFLIVGLADTIAKDLMLNRLTYEIDRKNRDVVVDNAVRFAYGFTMRAFEEGDRKFWKGSVSEIKTTQEISKPKGSSIMNPLSWGKK